MKKIFVLSLASIVLLTGCGATETLSCTYETTANNGSSKVKYDIDHQGNEVKKVRITYNYDFDDTNNNVDTRVAGDNTTGNADDDMTDNTNEDAYRNNNRENNTVEENDDATDNMNDRSNQIDGVGTGTDGTTNDTQIDKDGVIDGIVGSAIDTVVGTVTGIILDSAGLRDRHANVQNTYGNVNGFSVQNTNDTNNNYSVTYVIDYDSISDSDLATFNLVRNLDEMRENYVNQGFTCK